MQKPIWCKCRQHSWTRRQLYVAWVADRYLRCPEPTCGRDITLEAIESLLVDLGMVNLDDGPEAHEEGK